VSGITDALTGAIGDAGVYAVFALMFVDAIFPAGSEIVMLYAGAVAAGAFPDSQVTLFGVEIESTAWGYVVMSLAGALGYWLGSLLGWAIGLYGGHPLVLRYGRFVHLDKDKVDRAEVWFDRHGDAAVFWARNVPVVRSFISIPAGVFEMRFAPYALYSLLGSLPWAFGFAAAGVALGNGWERVHDSFRWVDYVVVGLIVGGIAYLIVRTVRRRARRRAEPPEERVGSGDLE
jgi:membrane protein DedA with SNARE-associated domain